MSEELAVKIAMIWLFVSGWLLGFGIRPAIDDLCAMAKTPPTQALVKEVNHG
jgi:hypothetical protein